MHRIMLFRTTGLYMQFCDSIRLGVSLFANWIPFKKAGKGFNNYHEMTSSGGLCMPCTELCVKGDVCCVEFICLGIPSPPFPR